MRERVARKYTRGNGECVQRADDVKEAERVFLSRLSVAELGSRGSCSYFTPPPSPDAFRPPVFALSSRRRAALLMRYYRLFAATSRPVADSHVTPLAHA